MSLGTTHRERSQRNRLVPRTQSGVLRDDGGRMRFRYDPDWLKGGFPVSLRLALGAAELDGHDFFAGLFDRCRWTLASVGSR